MIWWFCVPIPQQAGRAWQLLAQWMESVGLELHPDKTRLVDLHEEGFDFLGYHFQAGKPGPPRLVKWPRKKSMQTGISS